MTQHVRATTGGQSSYRRCDLSAARRGFGQCRRWPTHLGRRPHDDMSFVHRRTLAPWGVYVECTQLVSAWSETMQPVQDHTKATEPPQAPGAKESTGVVSNTE